VPPSEVSTPTTTKVPDATPTTALKPEMVEISFDIYDGPDFENFLFNIAIGSSLCRRSDLGPGGGILGPNQSRYLLPDWPVNMAGESTLGNIDVIVTYDTLGFPTHIQIVQQEVKVSGRFYDMLINGEVVLHHIDSHVGEVIEIEPLAPPDPGLPF
jgi:hypothetical protein